MKLVIARFVVIPVLLAVVFAPEAKAKGDIVCMNFDYYGGSPATVMKVTVVRPTEIAWSAGGFARTAVAFISAGSR
jgi:hypothetical protein